MPPSTARLLSVALLAAVLLSAQAAVGQAGNRLPTQFSIEATGVFGVGKAKLEGYTVYKALPDPSRSLLYVTGVSPNGQGYVAAIFTNGTVAWSQTLEGAGALLALDNPSRSKWLAVASSLGDIAVIDLDTHSFYAYYYRALRSKPTQLYITPGNNPKVIALDSEGTLYVFKPPEEKWFEMSLDPGQAALTYQSGVNVMMMSSLEKVAGLWDREAANEVAALISSLGEQLSASLYASAYYVTPAGEVKKAVTGTVTYNASGGITIQETRVLRLWIVDTYFHAPESLSGVQYPIEQTNGTGDIVVENLFPSRFYVYLEYEIIIQEVGGAELTITYQCYNNFTEIDFAPGSRVSMNFYLHLTNATNPGECQLIRSKYVREAGDVQVTHAAIAYLNITNLPSTYDPRKDLILRYIPLEGSGGNISFIKIYASSTTPEGWSPRGATYLLTLGSANSLFIYLLDDSLTAVNLSTGISEKVYFGSSPTAVEVSPPLDRIYVGTADGKVYELTWDPGLTKYVLTGSLVVSPSGAPITSLKLATKNLLLAATEDGAAQLIDTSAWKPLWRGPAVYPAILISQAVGLPGAEVSGLWYYPGTGLVGYFTGTDELLLPHGTDYLGPLYPVYVTLSTSLLRLDGSESQLPIDAQASYIEVIKDGSLAARLHFTQEGEQTYATLYLPGGSVIFRINASIANERWVIELDTSVNETINDVNITLKLREASVLVYTPDTGEIGYKLVAGPKQGAYVKLEPTAISPKLPYKPVDAKVLEGVTGPDGTVRFIVYDGVSYRVTGNLKGYVITPTSLEAFGQANVTLEADPVLYPLNVELVDSEILAYSGSKYYVPEANLTFTVSETGKTAWTIIKGGKATLYIPEGNYTVYVTARFYEPAETSIVIPKSSLLSVELDPIHFIVLLKIVVDDSTGLISGPARTVKVTASPLEFPLPKVADYTSSDGTVLFELHWGTYNLTISHPMLETTVITINVEGDSESVVLVKPRYSDLNITVLDAELASYGVLAQNSLVTLSYVGPFSGGSKTIKLDGGTGVVRLPYGYYSVTAVAPGYQETSELPLAIDSPQTHAIITLQPVKYPVTINVHVVDPLWNLASGPLEGVTVTVKITEPPYPIPASTLITGNDGSVTFNLRTGTYLVTLQHSLIGNYTAYIQVAGTAFITLQPTPIYVNVTLEAIDAEYLVRIPKATLTLYYTGVGERQITIPLENGIFKGLLPSGNYIFLISEPHYQEASVSARLIGIEVFDVTVPLQPIYQTLEVKVLSGSLVIGGSRFPEAPIPYATILLIPNDPILKGINITGYSSVADANGVARLKVRVGSYIIKATATSFQEANTSIDVLPTAPVKVNVRLKPILSQVKLTLKDPELTPQYSEIPGTIVLTSWNGVPIDMKIDVPQGGVTVLLPPGFYEALVKAQGYMSALYNFSVPGGPFTFNLIAEKVRVSIYIELKSDFGSSPASNLTITLTAIDIPLKIKSINLSLDINGVAVVELRRGNYTVTAIPPGYTQPVTLGFIMVEEENDYTFSVEAPLLTLNITVVDSEFSGYKIPANATIIYFGPYGSGDLTVTIPSGQTSLHLPPGSYQLTVSSSFYYANVIPVNLTTSTNVTVKLTPILSKVKVVVRDIDGNPVGGARIILSHTLIPYTVQTIADAHGQASFVQGVRLGVYNLTVTPPADIKYLKTYSSKITISMGQPTITITLMPKVFNVTIVLLDKETGEEVPFPYILSIARKGAGSALLAIPSEINITNGSVSVLLPYGAYTGKLEPVKEDYYNLPQQISFTVDKSKQVVVTLEPKLYTVTILVVDDRGAPLPGATVTLTDTHGLVHAAALTDENGQVTVQVRYGTYVVDVTKQGYKHALSQIEVPASTSLSVTLEPGFTVLLKRYSIFIVGLVGLVGAGYGILRLRERVAEKLAEEEYF